MCQYYSIIAEIAKSFSHTSIKRCEEVIGFIAKNKYNRNAISSVNCCLTNIQRKLCDYFFYGEIEIYIDELAIISEKLIIWQNELVEVDYKMVYKKEIILVVERISELCKTFSFELDNLIKIGNYDNFIIESLNDYSDAFKDESNYIHNSILKK